jgi:hypothetical protein
MFHDHQDTLQGPHFEAGLISASGGLARLHKGGGGGKPKLPKTDRKLEQMQMKLLKAQLKQAGRGIHIPHIEAPPPPPPPPPPPSLSSKDVQEAATDARRQALKRSGFQSTLFAGETGAKKTLLG